MTHALNAEAAAKRLLDEALSNGWIVLNDKIEPEARSLVLAQLMNFAHNMQGVGVNYGRSELARELRELLGAAP